MAEQTGTGSSGEVVMGDPRTTANDFDMYGANGVELTTQDANNLELSLLHLQESPSASTLIDYAAYMGVDVTFDHSLQNGLAYYDADGLGVTWNPDIGFQLDNELIISPSSILVSEFAHTVLQGGLDPNPTPDPVWGNSAEAIAHEAGNLVSAELGEPIRPDYQQGNFVDVPSVTSHGTPSEVYGGMLGTSGLGAQDNAGGMFDYGAFSAEYGVTNVGADSFGFDSFGADSFGADSFGGGFDSFGGGFDSYGSDSFGFDYGSFSADYGIDFGFDFGFDSFGGFGGAGGGGGAGSLNEYVVLV